MKLTFANQITICRILAVPFFIAAVLYYHPDQDHLRFVALGIFLFAVVSDFIDGYIARTRDQKTKAGAMLDPLADKILLISAFICLYKIGNHYTMFTFPAWLVITVISRDIILIVGALIIQMIRGDLMVNPTILGKTNTFFEIIAVFGVLLQMPFTSIFWYLVLVLAIVTLIDYIFKGIKMINNGSLA